ncbi:MAG: hypothetical protein EXR24_01690 [Ignavibacteria bacterium]|nr:hypothetical protein [Bacteroidota bacterium]MSQ45680.1 hypothetical protein [Ignavibacteria bacterium]
MKPNSKYIIFTGFDGTISNGDVCDNFFSEYSDYTKVNELYNEMLNHKITATDFWNKSFELLVNINPNNLNDFVSKQSIDGSFVKFDSFCKENNIPLIILSDGMSFYIKQILEKYKILLPYYSNNCEIINNRLIPNFPFTDSDCTSCANCKRDHMLTKSSDDQIIILIGNGKSDMCPAHYADIVFAKDDLLKYCESKNITYYSFQSFSDIENQMKNIITRKPKHRQTALHARRDVFISE